MDVLASVLKARMTTFNIHTNTRPSRITHLFCHFNLCNLIHAIYFDPTSVDFNLIRVHAGVGDQNLAIFQNYWSGTAKSYEKLQDFDCQHQHGH